MSKYSLDPIAANCYPGTTVLINKFGIRDDKKLLLAEIAITQEAAARWEQSPQFGSFDFAHYKAIHKHLLEDLYDWAGQVRDVNISKKGTRFCPYGEIEGQAERIFTRLLNKRLKAGAEAEIYWKMQVFVIMKKRSWQDGTHHDRYYQPRKA